MAALETLCLDLRGYSLPRGRTLSEGDVAKIARSLEGKGLGLLVIAGLRSWWRYPGADPLTVAEVEEGVWSDQRQLWLNPRDEREVNWWKVFRGAVRPGGRLVFVDRHDGGQLGLLQLASQS
jgi:hypothetical protein